MADVRRTQSPTERAFFVALRDLYLRAGEPSSREVARAIGGLSHTTVNLAVRGTSIPSWPVVLKLVEYFGGDLEHFRQLWVEAREPTSVAERSLPPDVSVFVSYARIDDQATYHRISQLADDVVNTYRSMTGQDVGVFQDVDSIKPGDNWKDRIRLGLSSSSILLAFISPAYLGSPSCREELSEFLAFLDANSSDRLVIPLLYADPSRIDARFPNDDLWTRLKTLHRVDISQLRSADPGTSPWILKVEEIASSIDEVLVEIEKSSEVARANEHGKPAPKTEEEIPEGLLERMAAIEEGMPSITDNVLQLGELLEKIGSETQAATPKMMQADTFGRKLAVSRELAARLSPVAGEIAARVDRLVSDLSAIDDFVTNILRFGKLASTKELEDPDTIAGLQAIWGMATVTSTALSQLEEFNHTLGQVIGFSRDLDRPLKTMRGAFLRMADTRGTVTVWLDELKALQSAHPGMVFIDAQ